MNQVNLVGRLTKAPHQLEGKEVSYLTLAIKNPYKKSEDGKPGVDFIDMAVFGQAAKFANEFLNKGDLVSVQASLSTFVKTEGDKIIDSSIKVNVNKLEILASHKPTTK